jgi:hypothetical protein
VDFMAYLRSTLCSHPAIIVQLKLLFDMMYLHGFVPYELCKGVTIPIPNDYKIGLVILPMQRTIDLLPLVQSYLRFLSPAVYTGLMNNCSIVIYSLGLNKTRVAHMIYF